MSWKPREEQVPRMGNTEILHFLERLREKIGMMISKLWMVLQRAIVVGGVSESGIRSSI